MFAPRVIERDGYKLVKLPFWMSESMAREVADRLRRDAAVDGRTLEITVGSRLMRVEDVTEARARESAAVREEFVRKFNEPHR